MIGGERETVVGDTRIDAMLVTKLADARADHACVAAHHRSDDGGSIADIERHAAQRLMALTDGSEVRNVEEGDTTGGHAVADGGSEQRVLDRKGLEAHRIDG